MALIVSVAGPFQAAGVGHYEEKARAMAARLGDPASQSPGARTPRVAGDGRRGRAPGSGRPARRVEPSLRSGGGAVTAGLRLLPLSPFPNWLLASPPPTLSRIGTGRLPAPPGLESRGRLSDRDWRKELSLRSRRVLPVSAEVGSERLRLPGGWGSPRLWGQVPAFCDSPARLAWRRSAAAAAGPRGSRPG